MATDWSQIFGALIISVGAFITVTGLNLMKILQLKYGANPFKFPSKTIFLSWFFRLSLFGWGQVLMVRSLFAILQCNHDVH